MARPPFTVGLVQDSAGNDRAENLANAVASIREAHRRGAQVICLKELFNAPYFCKSLRVEAFGLAEPIPGPTIEALSSLAAELEVVLVAPIYERQASGLYRNSAAIIDADGSLLGVYRKMHIPHDPLFEEKYYFAPGDADDNAPGRNGAWRGSHGFRVWHTRYADIGVLICWDQWYPEGARDHVAPRRRHPVLSDGDRLAPRRAGRVWRRAGGGVAHDPARARDRERRVRRVA